MNKREVVTLAMRHRPVPYVPWQINLTLEAQRLLAGHFRTDDVDRALDNHLLQLGGFDDYFRPVGGDCVEDYFGVVWDRSQDRDIGIVRNQLLPEPTLRGYEFPDPLDGRFFAGLESRIAADGDRFRVFNLGFSLFERAWTLRGGMEDLLMDLYLHPEFVRDLLRAVADYNIAHMRQAVKYDIDCIHFGDDWGQQHGLIMGYPLWKEFFYPELKRMYAVGVEAGKFVSIHSCGDVDELFDDLLEIGLNSFNPFQPEVMEVHGLLQRYHGRLCFYGGVSTQRTLPYGKKADVAAEVEALLQAGADGGLIVSPAHAVESDVPLANLLTLIEVLQAQPGYGGGTK